MNSVCESCMNPASMFGHRLNKVRVYAERLRNGNPEEKDMWLCDYCKNLMGTPREQQAS